MSQVDKGGLSLRLADSPKLKLGSIFRKKRKSSKTSEDSTTPRSADTAVFHIDELNTTSSISASEKSNNLTSQGTNSSNSKTSPPSIPSPYKENAARLNTDYTTKDDSIDVPRSRTIESTKVQDDSFENRNSAKAAVDELIPTFLDMRRRLITDLHIDPELYQKNIDAFCESRDEAQADEHFSRSNSPLISGGNGTVSRDGSNGDNYFNGHSSIEIPLVSRERAKRVRTALEIYFGSIERYCSVVHYEELGNGIQIPKYEGVEGVYNPLQIIRNRRIRKKNREQFQELAFNVVPLPSQVFSKYSRQRNIWQVNLRELRNDITWRESHWNELRNAKGKLWFPKTEPHLKSSSHNPSSEVTDKNKSSKNLGPDSALGVESPQRLHEQLFADFDGESVYAKYEDDVQLNEDLQVTSSHNQSSSHHNSITGGGSNSLKSLENGQLPKTSHSSLSLLRTEQYVPKTSLTSTNVPFKKSITSSSTSKLKRISRSPARLLNSLKSSDSLPLHNNKQTESEYITGRQLTNSSTDDESYTRTSSLVVPGTEDHPAIAVDEIHSVAYGEDNTGTALSSRRPSQTANSLENAISKINFERRVRSASTTSKNNFDPEVPIIGTGISVNDGNSNEEEDALDSNSVPVDIVISEDDNEKNEELELLEHVKLLKYLEGEVIVGGLTISAHEKNIEDILARNEELIKTEADIFFERVEEADLLTKEIQLKFNEFDKIIEQNLGVNNVQESKIDELLGFSDRTIGEINTSVALQIRNLSEKLDKLSSRSSRSGGSALTEDFLTNAFYNLLENFIVVSLWVVWIIVEVLRSFKLFFKFIYVILRWIFF